MRRIVKAIEPQTFSDWKAQANDVWQPSYSNLQNPEKRNLHDALLNEQGGLCCYCGRTIALTDSHIEHFRPQERFQELAMDYSNLHASCIRETEPGTPLHCGHSKGKDFDKDKIISPLDDGCEQRFIYSAQDGAIYPTDNSDESATYMIGLLKLDIKFLRDRRAEALKRVFDYDFISSASNDELEKLASAYQQPNAAGFLINFAHVLSRYAEQLIGHQS
ncbi:retron system putative HNH endonuclease [Methylomonas fluvii]|uniref:TIGR02646 family protein n=1 Tax=Methylomonas fluvii TaxID=1854564 RepID=A0ABR9DFV9_9GAMM|nr:retron system putative HNH endonuclease [Methylomonas fluvii]MBD9361983.1 TIGR02646 family protein [Methylomonas fluvii]CAD6875018.1 Glutamate synthase [NADPH] large chain (EC 1.4.1.13) [Methylomonas fluvii]